MCISEILPVRPPIPKGMGRGAMASAISLSPPFLFFSLSGGLFRAGFSSSIVSSTGG